MIAEKIAKKIEKIRDAAFEINKLEPTDETITSYLYGVIDLSNLLLVELGAELKTRRAE